MKLSLCIATHNEAENLHYPLDSAIDLVDEVIIVDGESEDRTIEVAKSYGPKVKVFQEKNPPMFHLNKQKAIERASGDWILQLDADEALSPELKNEIRSVISQSQSKPVTISKNKTDSTDSNRLQPISTGDLPVAYWIPRKNFFLNRFLTKGGQYPDYTIRLYKRGVAHFPCKSVHENVEITPNHPQGESSFHPKGGMGIGYLKTDLLHYADPTFERYLTRWNRYTSLDARLLVEKGERPGFFSYFIIKPKLWFLSTYIRHRGYKDGFPGFVFALFSALRFQVIYIKWWAFTHKKQT
jgi:glycosyltransferase involved in cell wall biosynthesis